METRNWVDDAGGLPAYIKQIADELQKNGHTESEAIAIAVSRVKVWAVTGKGDTKAKAAAALAEWEAKKVKAHADNKRAKPNRVFVAGATACDVCKRDSGKLADFNGYDLPHPNCKCEVTSLSELPRGIDMDTYEIRALGGTVQPEGDPDKRMFAARVVNYNKVDDHGTTWAPGVFTESLRAKKPAAVWSHDPKRPIGKVVDYRDSADGLDVIVQMADLDAVPDARMAHAILKDDIINEFSFAFSREADEDDPNVRGAVRITKARMHEVSPVLVASGQGTKTYGVRSATRAEANDLLNRVALGEITAGEALEQLSSEQRSTSETVTIPAVEYRSLMDKAGIKPPENTDDFSTEMRSIDDLLSEEW